MVDLPRYVKAQRKASGRLFVYYERFRGTARAWPRLPLLADTSDPEFWSRYRQYDRLEATADGEVWRWRLGGDAGRSYPLPDPRADRAAFWASLDAADVLEARAASGELKTFRALVAEFKEVRLGKLSAKTQGEYRRYLDVIEEAWSDAAVASVTTVDAQRVVDMYRDSPAAGVYFRAVLSRLLAFGVPRGYALQNVASLTEKPDHTSEPYKPWPDWALELFFEHARVGLQLAAYSALYTGQRSVDVITMTRPRPDAKAIELVARKTGAEVFVPIHFEYRQILDAALVVHPRLHLREDGEPWTQAGFKTAWQRDMTFEAGSGASAADRAKAAAMKRLRDEGLVFHGFRKNAVIALLEVGCTEGEVSAVVEMTPAMVRHYGQAVNRRRLAVNAMKKLEANWAEARRNLFGEGRKAAGGNG